MKNQSRSVRHAAALGAAVVLNLLAPVGSVRAEDKTKAPVSVMPGPDDVQTSVPVGKPIHKKQQESLEPIDPNKPLPLHLVYCEAGAGSVKGGKANDGSTSSLSLNAGCSGTVAIPAKYYESYYRLDGGLGLAGKALVGNAKFAYLSSIGDHRYQVISADGHATPTTYGGIISYGVRWGSVSDRSGSYFQAGAGFMGWMHDRVSGLEAIEPIEGQISAALALTRRLALGFDGTYGFIIPGQDQAAVNVPGVKKKVLADESGDNVKSHLETHLDLHVGQNLWLMAYVNTDGTKMGAHTTENGNSQSGYPIPGDAASVGSQSWGAGLRAGGSLP